MSDVHQTIDFEREISARVIEIVAAQAGRREIGPDTALEQLKFDSFALVSLMFAVEEEFQIEISDADLLGLKTVGDIVRKVESVCDIR